MEEDTRGHPHGSVGSQATFSGERAKELAHAEINGFLRPMNRLDVHDGQLQIGQAFAGKPYIKQALADKAKHPLVIGIIGGGIKKGLQFK